MIAQTADAWQDERMPTVITVQGSFTAWYPAERATVRLAVAFDGAKRDGVLSANDRRLEDLRAVDQSLHLAADSAVALPDLLGD